MCGERELIKDEHLPCLKAGREQFITGTGRTEGHWKGSFKPWYCSALGTHGKFTLVWFKVAFFMMIFF